MSRHPTITIVEGKRFPCKNDHRSSTVRLLNLLDTLRVRLEGEGVEEIMHRCVSTLVNSQRNAW